MYYGKPTIKLIIGLIFLIIYNTFLLFLKYSHSKKLKAIDTYLYIIGLHGETIKQFYNRMKDGLFIIERYYVLAEIN